MKYLLRKIPLQHFAVFLVAAILLVEFAATKHAIEHSFADADEICSVCEKADNFQNSLVGSDDPVQVIKSDATNNPVFYQTGVFRLFRPFQARAPPASSPI